MLFGVFCDEITAAVERRIVSWHGGVEISGIEAIELLRHNYMLGGFRCMWPLIERIDKQGNLMRDQNALCQYFSRYGHRYSLCESQSDLCALRDEIFNDLWEFTLSNSLTYVFGG